MNWSKQTLKQIYDAGYHEGRVWQNYPNRSSLGEHWPYRGGSDLDIEAYLHSVAAYLGDSGLISVEADFNSFGSGYASFVELFCTKKDGTSGRTFLGSGEKFTGICVYVSRLAPVVTYGAGERTRHAHGGSSSFLSYDTLGTTPPGDWAGVLEEVSAKLKENGFEMTEPEILNEILPFEAIIETNLGEYPHRVFDLLFHWYD